MSIKFSIAILCLLSALSQVRIPGPGGAGASSGGSSSPSCTPASGFAYCRTLTIQSSQAGGTTLANFAVLVNGTLGASRIQSTSCNDVIFTSDSAGTTKVPWEMESCAQSSGTIIAWVGLTSISASVNTNFYVSYDNASISSAQNTGSFASSNVWDSNFDAVWHLPNGSVLSAADSTSHANVGAVNSGVTASSGEIDGAASFTGSAPGQDISLSAATSLQITGALTIEAWVNSTNNSQEMIFGGYQAASSYPGYGLAIGVVSNGRPCYWSGAKGSWVGSSNGVNDGNWHYVVVSVTSGGSVTFYIDGTVSGTPSSAAPNSYTGVMSIGADSSGGSPFKGAIDELRISSTNRASGWLTACYNNQKSGSSFLTLGSEY